MPHCHDHAFQSFNARQREGLVLHSRRNFLKASLAGIAGLTVPSMLQSHANATAAGQTTWYGLARAVFEEIGADPDRIRPTTTDRFPRPAPRPAYSVLGHDAWHRAGLEPLGDWRAMLHEVAPVVTGR